MAQWRMPQLCWGTQDIHNDNRWSNNYVLLVSSLIPLAISYVLTPHSLTLASCVPPSEFQSYHLAEDPGNKRSDKELLLGLSTTR